METFSMRIVHKVQEYKTQKLQGLAKKLLRLGFTANIMTIIALICGLLAVYFLFNNTLLFIFFILLHLLADSLDGVLARLTKTSPLGTFLDHILSDGLVTILPLIKIGMLLQDAYAYLAAALFTLALLFYALSRYQAPILFMRMYVVIGLVISLLIYPLTSQLLTVLYLSVVVAGGYSLARQLQWFITKDTDN